MPRKSRKLLDNKICHIIVQGINKEYIYQEAEDKNKYINLLKKYYKDYEIDIICYCIMDNHAHLILYSDNIENISTFMKQVNSIYAMYYNKKYNRVGYVFRDRFKSILIMKKEQLYTCIKYIHMNPVKAKIVKEEGDYKYSSYNDYLTKTGFLNQRILNFLFAQTQNYIEKFKSFPYKDIYDNKVNIKELLNKFLSKENISLNQLKKERELLEKFLSYLDFKNLKYSKQELANILEIGRATLYRKIRKGRMKNGRNKKNETKKPRP